MGLKLENVITGFVLFSIIVGLISGIYLGISTEYKIEPDYVNVEGESVIEALTSINIISGLKEVKDVINSVYDAGGSTGSEFDILGSMRAGAMGVVKIGTGILTAPLEIIAVIFSPIIGFYTIPSSVYMGIGLIIIVYLGYMLVNELLGK